MESTFYEFFAGGGMARLGLGPHWRCEFANDISPLKAAAYKQNFDGQNEVFTCCDINDLHVSQIPGSADLVWGSFPCQDLSLAGAGRGLDGSRSGLIWTLLDICDQLRHQRRGPKIIALENVPGLLNSRKGQDFYDILEALGNAGYVFGVLTMDAVHFLPQSRPRVFLVAVDNTQICIPKHLLSSCPKPGHLWSSERLNSLWRDAPAALLSNWIWWNVPEPTIRKATIADVIDPSAANWDSPEYTTRLLDLMAPLHRAKVEKARLLGLQVFGTLYRRTRLQEGIRGQRVEVRFDGISGCLRTPSGGSSRQRLLIVENKLIRSRLMTSRELARLMGLPEDYRLPATYNDAYHLVGDGVAVPVVEWLSQKILTPLLSAESMLTEDEVELLYA